MNWDDFKFVHALARTGTVRRAGRLLGVHASTVVRRLDALEHRMGVKLFSRTRDGMRLTAAGEELVETLDSVAREMDVLTRRLRARDSGRSGPVSLAAPELMLTLLAGGLSDFQAQYPEVRLDLYPSEGAAMVDTVAADLTLRITGNPPADLIGRNMGPSSMAIYGSRAYLKDRDPLVVPAGCLWVDAAEPAPALKARYFAEIKTGIVSSSGAVRLAALRAGLGVGPLPCLIGDSDPELARVAVDPVVAGDLWLLSHPDLRAVPRVQALSAFLANFIHSALPSAALARV